MNSLLDTVTRDKLLSDINATDMQRVHDILAPHCVGDPTWDMCTAYILGRKQGIHDERRLKGKMKKQSSLPPPSKAR